jgi:hypothetical protein
MHMKNDNDKKMFDVYWVHLLEVASSCEHGNELWVPYKARNFLTSLATINFLHSALWDL